MKNFFANLIIICALVLPLVCCMPVEVPFTPTASARSTTISTPNIRTTSPLPEGDLLLIQTGYESYQLVDVHQQKTYPFTLPADVRHLNLAENLSPGRKKMFFATDDEKIVIMDFDRNWEHSPFEISLQTSLFQPEKAAEKALEMLPELNISRSELLASVIQALSQSKNKLHWYKNDRYLFLVQETGETTTNLFLHDLQTDTQVQIEGKPALVQDYLISPGGDDLLLKKGFVFGANTWQDDSYYLVNISTHSTEPIMLPQGSDHPSLSWLGAQFIGITHQTQPLGGVDFSVVNVTTMESKKIIQGASSQIYLIDENLLVLKQNLEKKATTIELMDFSGGISASHSLEYICVINTIFKKLIFLNCETDSLVLDESLQPQSFGEPLFLLSPAPDGQSAVLILRDGKVYLLNGKLMDRQPLNLNGEALEILWLPDSSGFLYRTLGELFYYDLKNNQSSLILSSDLFGDYSNLNAVWINFD